LKISPDRLTVRTIDAVAAVVLLFALSGVWAQNAPDSSAPATRPTHSSEYMDVCGTPAVQPCAEAAKALKAPAPSYTKQARAARIQGAVSMIVLVGLDGKAQKIIVTKGPGYGLEVQAIKAVNKWKFEPCTYQGAPVVAWQNVLVNFHLY
jgi:TonB family protein